LLVGLVIDCTAHETEKAVAVECVFLQLFLRHPGPGKQGVVTIDDGLARGWKHAYG
jgi:hypothetical protein